MSKGDLPKEIGVTLRLEPGQSWKSRFVSTAEVKRSLKGGDGKVQEKSRTVGIEVVALQKVLSVEGGKAVVEVTESSTRILQDGKFVEAPFRKFSPPNPGTFTIDLATAKLDFSGMAKSWADWMEGLKGTPAGEILGKSFRVDAYVAQLEDLYGKPFNRLAGRRLSKEMKPDGGREQVLPFVGPAVALYPVPVVSSAAWEGFERKDGVHLLRVMGKYEGAAQWGREEAAVRLADFGASLPAGENFGSSLEVTGKFRSSVDVLAGREIVSESDLLYRGTLSFGAATLTEEIKGKFMMDPAE
jgi:hypothetical protein